MNADLDVACHLNIFAPGLSSKQLPAALDAIAAAGYRRLVLPPLDPDDVDVPALRALLAARGLAPITMAGQSPDADVSSPSEDVRQAGVTLLRRTLDLTVALGADQMNGVPYGIFGHPTGPTGRDAFERSAAEVGSIADESHDRGVLMTFEVLNRYETSVVNTAAQAMEYVAASGSEHLGIHLDTFHMAIEEADASAAIRTALPRLRYLELGQSGRGPLSSGAVDIAGIVRQALEDGYEGRWGIEAFSRSTLGRPASDMLSIWRSPYQHAAALSADAANTIDTGWASKTAARV
ncbi:sugar phosphate isomerase/epimerase family protein [Pseudarthrobacter sp. NKDBFgelt]|uniref:sugar phosphate isomerase/epimerase family protein n=1 Tax=Pseudarthrobacter sp. NKDBFgelt TaxID=3384443 RepID=UPI0038D4ED31